MKIRDDITVKELPDSKYDEWEALIVNAPAGTIYSSSKYLDLLCAATDARFRILGVYQRDELIGGIAIVEATHRTGTIISTRLLLYYNGVVVKPSASRYPSEQTSRELQVGAAIASFLASMRPVKLLLQNAPPFVDVRPFLEQGWSSELSYTYRVPLAHLEQQWERVEKNCKRLVRRAESEGVELSEDDDCESLYRLHLAIHERKGSPVYLPQDRFRRFCDGLYAAKLGQIFHARLAGGESVAAQLVLGGGHPLAHIVCAGADARYHSLGASPFVRWKSFESLSRSGYSAVDLTDAGLNSVAHFKSQFGGDLVPIIRVFRPEALSYRSYVALGGVVRRLRSALSAKHDPSIETETEPVSAMSTK